MKPLPTTLILAAIASVLPALPVAAQVPTTAPTADLDPSRIVAGQIATLRRDLVEAGASQEARDAAARRLLAIGTPEARALVQSALRDPGNNPGRLAAARAVVDDLPGDPAFVDSLFVLIDGDVPRPIVDAAVVALGNFKLEPAVSTRLVELSQAGRPEAQRVAAIRALAGQVEKRAAQQLVALSQDPSPAIAAAATEAVRAFASRPVASPAEWWRTRADQPDDRFRLEMLAARTTRSEGENRRGEETYQELRRSVLAVIAAAPREQRGDVLNGYLNSPREAIRQIAVTQAYEYATTGDLAPSARPAVRRLLADSDPDVRLTAARTMAITNDADAFAAIAQQLAVESDPRVRAELARTMGPIGNIEAVPLLRWLLDDPSPSVLMSAANALARLGPAIVERNPIEAADLSVRLQTLLQTRGRDRAGEGGRLREAIVEALVPLRQPSMLTTYIALLTATPSESETIRRLSAAGLGAIGRPETAELLVDALRDDSPLVRAEAARAIGAIGESAKTFENAGAILRAMDPTRESDANVVAAEWAAIRQLMPFAPRNQLAAWPNQPNIRDHDDRLLDVFDMLAQKAAAAQAWDEQTFYLQQLGNTQMRLGEVAESALDVPTARQRFSDATASYQQALTITREKGGPSMRVQTMIVNTLKAMLRARDYAGAAAFASEQFKGPGGEELKGTLGPEFKLEAERIQEKQPDDAVTLISAALSMSPALAAQHRGHLQEVQRTIDRRQREKNEYAVPEFLQSLAVAR